MDPNQIHVDEFNSPACFPKKESDVGNYINISTLCIYMNIHENNNKGEYYSLDIKIWKLLKINKKTDLRGRVNVNENNSGKEIRVFISDVDHEPEICKSYILLAHSIYTEVRKSRIKDQTGEPLKVQTNGSIWLGSENKNKFVKVFVRIETNE
jgi:hypothetical protein